MQKKNMVNETEMLFKTLQAMFLYWKNEDYMRY